MKQFFSFSLLDPLFSSSARNFSLYVYYIRATGFLRARLLSVRRVNYDNFEILRISKNSNLPNGTNAFRIECSLFPSFHLPPTLSLFLSANDMALDARQMQFGTWYLVLFEVSSVLLPSFLTSSTSLLFFKRSTHRSISLLHFPPFDIVCIGSKIVFN